MPTYQTLTEGLYNTAVGKSFLVKGIEYIKMNEALLMRKDTGTYYTYGIDFGKMPGVRRHIVGGTYRTLISVQNPLRLCRTGICRSLSAG